MAEGLVFRRDQSEDSDVWDDEALIKAYDKAVKAVKNEIQNEKNGDASEQAESSDHSKTPLQDKKKFTGTSAKKSKRKKKKAKWNVGDHCRAVYSEDGLIYDCVIQFIDTDNGTCLVRYTDYGNEENVELSGLLPPESENPPLPNENVSDSQPMEWSDPSQSPAHPGLGQTRYQGNPSRMQHPPAPFPRIPPHFHSVHPFTSPYFQAFPYGPGPSWPSGLYPGTPPRIPPIPPPPAVTQDVLDGDEDALFSMLISWYMSGYHTGYYQGMKAARQGERSQPNTPQRESARSPWRPRSSPASHPNNQDSSSKPAKSTR